MGIRQITAAALLTIAAFGFPTAAYCDENPSAIIEDISDGIQGLMAFDFLSAGDTVDLGSDGRIVLGYLDSCLSETVVGGKLTIGRNQSDVSGGKVTRDRVECDGAGITVAAGKKRESGAVVFRAGAKGSRKRPAMTIYGRQPLIAAPGKNGMIDFERLDRSGGTLKVALKDGVADLALTDQRLALGGIYSVKLGSRSIIFRVDRYARPGDLPALSRLIRF